MTTWNLEGTVCHLLVCGGSSCRKRRGEEVLKAVEKEIGKQGADARIHVTETRCNGRCSDAPVAIAYPEGVWYGGLTPKAGKELVRRTLEGGGLEEYAVYNFEAGSMKAAVKKGGRGKRKPGKKDSPD
ncbi:(2Fe-2S) ferredoxin domain-containing protein [Paenibacillus spiritus]|uniref:(2Fe-2S) ferredoxin domain-containing protein n=2 Tax=Paenibacillus TaxID=44249 RepID=A0A5J5GIA0_9BACL|nr:(2Fe-2S) ferredoxin domain-containing protein [Paenibacillus spiritus]KAA9007423.1 (2Fe-2S) ferredoxin domain-containing protein [Paenibacillus spiritus]